MKAILTVVLGCYVTCFGGGLLWGQHLHKHGDHFDVHRNVPHGHDRSGHLVDGLGHHIDGDGQHTGRIGVYENGARDYAAHDGWGSQYPGYYPNQYPSQRNYYSPLLSSPAYVAPYYPTLPNLYSAPSYLSPPLPIGPLGGVPPIARSGIANVAVNRIPVPNLNALPPTAAVADGKIALRNPRATGGAISYTLNGYPYTMKPGELQSIPFDRDWLIRFDNGLGKTLSYRLQPGDFDFEVSQDRGWDVTRRVEPTIANPQVDVPVDLPL